MKSRKPKRLIPRPDYYIVWEIFGSRPSDRKKYGPLTATEAYGTAAGFDRCLVYGCNYAGRFEHLTLMDLKADCQ
jgi:hypothetical protein